MTTARLDTLSVLLLDDHRFMQEVLRAILFGLGVKHVTSVGDVEEAVRVFEAKPFDIVITDYRLDGATGADFVKRMRASRADEDRFVPIIACTADTTPRVVRELRDAGVDEVLGKPVSPHEIWVKLTAVVNSRRQFVTTPQFFGPDRRRMSKAAPGAGERRKPR